jgi:hypothetical protein
MLPALNGYLRPTFMSSAHLRVRDPLRGHGGVPKRRTRTANRSLWRSGRRLCSRESPPSVTSGMLMCMIGDRPCITSAQDSGIAKTETDAH